MKKKTFILIDTDNQFRKRFEEKLKIHQLNEDYEVLMIEPDTTLPSVNLPNDCFSKVKAVMDEGAEIAAIFIDIVIIESGALDDSGKEIAKYLRKHYPTLPIFSITSKLNSPEEYDLFSMTTLEDVDGVFVKQFIDGKSFSPDRLKIVLQKSNEKRSKYYEMKRIEHIISEKIKSDFNPDNVEPQLSVQIDELGSLSFWNLIAKCLDNSQGIVYYMSPGRSGCYVVKIISKSKNESGATMLPKWWVVKISKGNCQILEDEISNYNELIKTPLPREAFPKLLHSKPIVYSDLSAIVLEFENEAQTFKDYLNSEEITKAQTNIVTKQLAEYLTKLYGDPIKKLSQVWKDYYSFKGKVIVYIESFFKLNKNVLASILDNQMLNRVSQFISSSGKSEEKIFNYRKDIDTRVVHGDLNSRNVLVRSDGKPVFIDFALRKQSPVTIDIAKLERDLIFRVCDADTKSEFDWNSIVKWREFDKLYNTSEVLNLKESDINSLQSYEKIISTILVLRNHLIGMSSGTDDKEYMLALLHYSILVLGNSEISLQKKVYCIEYIYNIICKFDQS